MDPEEAKAAAEQAELYREEAEVRAEQLALLLARGDGNEEREARLAGLIARSAAMAALVALLGQLGVRERPAPGSSPAKVFSGISRMPGTQALAGDAELAEKLIADDVLSDARKVASAAAGVDPPAARSWAKSVAATLATRATSVAAVAMAPVVSAYLGVELKKLWVTRGDAKVRESHRLLHAQTAPLDGEFSAGTARLAFPGDAAAPIEEWINCRCGLMLVAEPEADLAEEVLHMEPSEFGAMAASGWSELVERTLSTLR